MKFGILSLALLLPLLSQAHTELQFFLGGRALMTISSVDGLGHTSDDDASKLYAMMNVPTQNSPMGVGKGISTDNKDFNFSCGNAPQRGPMCSVVFDESSRVQMQPLSHRLTYHMTGADADAMSKQWFLQSGKMNFISADGLFKMEISPGDFRLEVSGN